MKQLPIKFTRHDLMAFVTYLNEELTQYEKRRTLEWQTCYELLVKLYKRGLDFNAKRFTHTFTYAQALAFGKIYLADARQFGITFSVARDVFAQLDAEFNLTAELVPHKMKVA